MEYIRLADSVGARSRIDSRLFRRWFTTGRREMFSIQEVERESHNSSVTIESTTSILHRWLQWAVKWLDDCHKLWITQMHRTSITTYAELRPCNFSPIFFFFICHSPWARPSQRYGVLDATVARRDGLPASSKAGGTSRVKVISKIFELTHTSRRFRGLHTRNGRLRAGEIPRGR